ncbi:MAG: tetratricopeptide repeat protein [Myxococcota bacterium]
MATPLRPARSREYQLLTDAHRARNQGKARAAIRLYRRILVENPANLEVALRVAPMLAWAGESFEAWQLYRRAAMEYARARQWTECLAVYREACRFVPGEFEAWRLCAELQLKLKKPEGAFETLIEGRLHFGGPHQRGQAIALLTRAREIEPWDDDLLLDLAALYAANDQAELALELLSTLALRVRGPLLRRVRRLQLRLTAAPRYAWLWLRTFAPSEAIPPIVERDFAPIEAAERSALSDAPVIESPPRLRRVSMG